MKVTSILNDAEKDESHNEHWKYCQIIGKLNFLKKSTQPDIAYTVHNCTRFMEHPKKVHSMAIKDIVRYLLGTKDQGIVMAPNKGGLKCFVDADFCGLWQND